VSELASHVNDFDAWHRAYRNTFWKSIKQRIDSGEVDCRGLSTVSKMWDTGQKGADMGIVKMMDDMWASVRKCMSSIEAASLKTLNQSVTPPDPSKFEKSTKTRHIWTFFLQYQYKQYVDARKVLASIFPTPDETPQYLVKWFSGLTTFGTKLEEFAKDAFNPSAQPEDLQIRKEMLSSLMLQLENIIKAQRSSLVSLFGVTKAPKPLKDVLDMFTLRGTTNEEKLTYLNKQMRDTAIGSQLSKNFSQRWVQLVWFANPTLNGTEPDFEYPMISDKPTADKYARDYPNLLAGGEVPDWLRIFDVLAKVCDVLSKRSEFISTVAVPTLRAAGTVYEQSAGNANADQAWKDFSMTCVAATFAGYIFAVLSQAAAKLTASVKMADLLAFGVFGLGIESSVYYALSGDFQLSMSLKKNPMQASDPETWVVSDSALLNDDKGEARTRNPYSDPKFELAPTDRLLQTDDIYDSRADWNNCPIDTIMVEQGVDPATSFDELRELKAIYEESRQLVAAGKEDSVAKEIVDFLQRPEYTTFPDGQKRLLTAYFTVNDTADIPDSAKGKELAYPMLLHPAFFCTVPFPVSKIPSTRYKNDYVDLITQSGLPRWGSCCGGSLGSKASKDKQRLIAELAPIYGSNATAEVDAVFVQQKEARWEVYEKCSKLSLTPGDEIAPSFRDVFNRMVGWKQQALKEYLDNPQSFERLMAFVKKGDDVKATQWLFEPNGYASTKNPFVPEDGPRAKIMTVLENVRLPANSSIVEAIIRGLLTWLTETEDGDYRWRHIRDFKSGQIITILTNPSTGLAVIKEKAKDIFGAVFSDTKLNASEIATAKDPPGGYDATIAALGRMFDKLSKELAVLGIKGNMRSPSLTRFLKHRTAALASKPPAQWKSPESLAEAKQLAIDFHVVMSWSAAINVYLQQAQFFKAQKDANVYRDSLANMVTNGTLKLSFA
jgi:hypothetical protein